MKVIEKSRKEFYSLLEENLRDEFLQAAKIMNRSKLDEAEISYLDDFILKLSGLFQEFKCPKNIVLTRRLNFFFRDYNSHEQLGQERLKELLNKY